MCDFCPDIPDSVIINRQATAIGHLRKSLERIQVLANNKGGLAKDIWEEANAGLKGTTIEEERKKAEKND